jgi:hypothetical protein
MEKTEEKIQPKPIVAVECDLLPPVDPAQQVAY